MTKQNMNTEIAQVNHAMWTISHHLDDALAEFEAFAYQKSVTERDYRKAKAMAIVEQRKLKTPSSLIADIVAGEVSELKYQRDLAAELYKVKQFEIENARAKLSAMQSINRTANEV